MKLSHTNNVIVSSTVIYKDGGPSLVEPLLLVILCEGHGCDLKTSRTLWKLFAFRTSPFFPSRFFKACFLVTSALNVGLELMAPGSRVACATD